MSGFFVMIALQVAGAYIWAASAICLLAASELMWPRETFLPLKQRLHLFGFLLLYIPIYYLSVGLIMRSVNVAPLFPGFGFGEAIVAVLVADFCYYCYHRAQHSIPWLWRIHAVHHSAERLGAGAGFHHPFEAPLRGLLVSIPTAFLFGGNWGLVAWLFVNFHGYYVHSTTRLNFGKATWLVCDNRVHRIHHSLEPKHFNKNFGIVTLLWDRLFGTCYWPEDEWPLVGVADQPEPRSIRNWLSAPFLHPPVKADDRPVHEIASG